MLDNVCQAYKSSAGFTLVLLGKELRFTSLDIESHKYACELKYLHVVQLLCQRKVAMHGGI